MLTHMRLAVRVLGKGFRTVWTLVRPLSSMGAQMHLEIVGFQKGARTVGALQWSFVGMAT